MKIHTDKITWTDLRWTLSETTTGVWLDRSIERGSRSRARAFDVALESDGTPDAHGTPRRRKRNMGTSRSADRFSSGYAASYDDWGHWLAALFEIDPNALAGPYSGYEDFHLKTAGAYLRAKAGV